jgi:signal peptidase I
MAKRKKQPGEGSGGPTGIEGEGPPSGNGKEVVREKPNAAKEWAKSLILAFVLFFFIRTFLTNTVVIISGSMEDTLQIGDFLIVNRAAMGSRVPGTPWRIPGYSKPNRGDVLVFDPHHEEDMKLVKRLLGLPGDTLEMRRKQLFVNGQALVEPYVHFVDNGGEYVDTIMNWQKDYLVPGVEPDTYEPTRDTWGPIVVPEGHYFMLGDNRDSSYDSRYWGPLAEWRIEGRPSLTYFSYDRDSMRPFPWIREVRWGRIFHRVN